jgi:S-DNA-T family DNA segregation ATPase FtsK/SpoIIIE
MASSPANIRRDPRALVEPKRHEVLGIVAFALGSLLALALVSYHAAGGADWVGPVGAQLAEVLIAFLGTAALLVPWTFGALAVRLFQRSAEPIKPLRALGTLAIVATAATGLHLWLGEQPCLGGLAAGGLVGATIGEFLRATVGTAGAFTVVFTALLVALVVRTRLSVLSMAEGARDVGSKGGVLAKNGAVLLARAWRESHKDDPKAARKERTSAAPKAPAPEDLTARALRPVFDAPPESIDEPDDEPAPSAASPSPDAIIAALTGSAGDSSPTPAPPPRKSRRKPVEAPPAPPPEPLVVHRPTPVAPPAPVAAPVAAPAPLTAPTSEDDPPFDLVDPEPKRPVRARPKPEPKPEPKPVVRPEVKAPPPPLDDDEDEESDDAFAAAAEAERSAPVAEPTADDGPLNIVSHEREIERARKNASLVAPSEPSPARTPNAEDMQLPDLDLLSAPPPTRVQFDEGQLRATADQLVKTLADYTIEGRVVEVHPGPVVTTFEVVPAAGTRLSKIARLSDDIAMSLEASKVRIVAPIPGKGRVGFEVPNAQRQMVYLRELIETEAFQKLGGALPVAIGKDVVGAPYFADLASMPHLIVAGATGQGKSVGLNVMLASLLYKRTPDDVRMLMIDPKMVELAVYDNIPHMLLPVVTDMKKAALALRWVVDEMERRYSLFAQTGSRNIITYNERVAKALAEGKTVRGMDGPVRTKETGTTVEIKAAEGESADAALAKAGAATARKLPYIVVVVDEFADLIMVAGKDIEAAVARLAQKARAAGIHVILATQRPSVDVITGMIKANFPARIAFKVSQKLDSRVILDQQGAEHLLGKGDMLILPPGSSDLRRVHCAFVNEDEVQRITDHWREQGKPTYDEDILKPREDEESGESDGPAEIKVPQDKYERAVTLVLTQRKCSVSMVQRYLGIGYNVAARIVDKMEREGVVGAPKGPGKDREVLG